MGHGRPSTLAGMVMRGKRRAMVSFAAMTLVLVSAGGAWAAMSSGATTSTSQSEADLSSTDTDSSSSTTSSGEPTTSSSISSAPTSETTLPRHQGMMTTATRLRKAKVARRSTKRRAAHVSPDGVTATRTTATAVRRDKTRRTACRRTRPRHVSPGGVAATRITATPVHRVNRPFTSAHLPRSEMHPIAHDSRVVPGCTPGPVASSALGVGAQSLRRRRR